MKPVCLQMVSVIEVECYYQTIVEKGSITEDEMSECATRDSVTDEVRGGRVYMGHVITEREEWHKGGQITAELILKISVQPSRDCTRR